MLKSYNLLSVVLVFALIMLLAETSQEWVYQATLRSSTAVSKSLILDSFIDKIWSQFYDKKDIDIPGMTQEISDFFANYDMLCISLHTTDGSLISQESESGIAEFAHAQALKDVFPKLKSRVIATQVGPYLFVSNVVYLYDNGSYYQSNGAKAKAVIILTYDYSDLADTMQKIYSMIRLTIIMLFLITTGLIIYQYRKNQEPLLEQQKENVLLSKALASTRNDSAGKSLFFANFSHELCTPLNAIIGFSEVMQKDQKLEDKYREYAQFINESGKHLLEIINDILDYFRLEAHHIEIEKTRIDIAKIVRLCVGIVQVEANRKRLTIATELNTAIINADARRIKQVILNILSNAVKFTPEGGRISIAIRARAGKVCTTIIDSGIGIAEEDIAKIFIPFGRVAKNGAPGVGLGLSIALELTKLMNGEFNIKSKAGIGTKVEIIFDSENGRSDRI